MTNCKSLDHPVFLAAQKIKGFEETDEGFLLECFLINDKVNQNDWVVTADANLQDAHTFEGRPDIEFFNEDGKRDHTVGKSFEDSIRVQEPFRKGTMRKVIVKQEGKEVTSISLITDRDIIRKIKSHEIEFVSPAVFPRSLEDIEIIRTGPDTHVHVLHRYRGLHRAFVDEPAYGNLDAQLGQTCEGNIGDCMIKLEQVQAGIGDSEIKPLRELKIVTVSKCKVTGNTIVEFENTSQVTKKSVTKHMANEEIKKEVDAAISKFKADFEEKLKSKANIETEEEKTSRIAQEEKDKDAKKSKANGEENKEEKANDVTEKEKDAKKAQDEEKEKDMTARIAAEISEKLPLIDKFVAAKTQVAFLDEKAQTALRESLMKASLDEVKSKWETIKEFAAAIPTTKSTDSPIGYGAVTTETASSNFEDMDTKELEKAAGVEA